MAESVNNDERGDISPELDQLSSALMGDALDLLADGQPVNVLVVVEDAQRNVASFQFADDGPAETLRAAHEQVLKLAAAGGDPKSHLGEPVRYAVAYEGMVCDTDGAYRDALLVEFGERGRKSYSAYSFFTGRGKHGRFRWSEPAPAGELDSLL